ncbi:phosphate ABC transporter permease subunit PstC [Natronomonas sp.]|uniref:phosphate ABC transporter permease subunit PstC n=1 Tax=Natronomonas sp. TaxID=2184060 RepID=UPI003975473C
MAFDSSPELTGTEIRSTRERVYGTVFFLCASLSVLITLAIIGTLLFDALRFFSEYSIIAFLTGTRWSPSINPIEFGVLPLVTGTLAVTVIAAAIAMPIGVSAAVYLSEYASDRTRSVLKPALEVLAGIPTVVYGYFALVYITPALEVVGIELSTFNVLSASIMVGIMIIPMVSSLSEDAMSSVPDSLREAGYGMGATKFEVSTGIVIPAAVSGIFASFILALSRAIGETMIVTVAMGMRARMFAPENIADLPAEIAYIASNSGSTMTAAIINLGLSDLAGGTTAFYSLFAIGLTLFTMTFLMNLASDIIANRFREEYQ